MVGKALVAGRHGQYREDRGKGAATCQHRKKYMTMHTEVAWWGGVV